MIVPACWRSCWPKNMLLALPSPPDTLLPILPMTPLSLPTNISLRSSCSSARMAEISPSRAPTCLCIAACSSRNVSFTLSSSDATVLLSNVPSLPLAFRAVCRPVLLACADCGRIGDERIGGRPSHSAIWPCIVSVSLTSAGNCAQRTAHICEYGLCTYRRPGGPARRP